MSSGFRVANAYVSVVADDTGLRESMTAKIKAAAEGLDAQIRLTVSDEGLREQVAADAAAAGEGEHASIGVELADSIERLREEVRAVAEEAAAGQDVHLQVHVDQLGALQDLRGGLDEIASSSDRTGAAVDDLGGRLDDVGGRAQGAGAAASNAGGGFGGMSGMMMAAVAAAVTLGPALAALPALLAGLGLGGVAAFGALKDVVGALTAANTSAGAAGQSAAAAAQTAFQNALAIRNAEASIVQAKDQAAQASIQSANSMIAANQQVAQSEQQEAQAARALAQARIDAVNQIADLNNSAADAANSVSDAQLGVQQAQQNLTSVMANSLSTDLQKRQAQQALTDAEQALTDAKQRAKEATAASDKATQEGVNGLPAVVAAEYSYQQAVQGVANAQRALATTQEQAAYQQQQSVRAVTQAEQNLTDTYRQQQLAAAAAASSGASGANAYAQAMAKLTPVGQQVVELLRGMNTGFTAAAQNSFLPGVLAFLKDVVPVMPQFVGMVSLAGQAFGGVIAQIGALFKNQAFVKDFFTVLQQGVGLLSTIGGGVIRMIQGVTEAAASAGPIVSAVGQGIADILAAIGPLLQGLADGGQGAAQTIQSVLDLVAGLLGPLGTLIGAISGALGPALKVLVPVVLALVNAFVKALLPSLPQLSTALLAVANILLLLLPAVTPLIGYLGTGLAGALSVVANLFQGLNTFISDNIGWLRPLTEIVLGVIAAMKLWAIAQWAINAAMRANPIGLLITAILALVGSVVYAYDHFKSFHDFIDQMWKDFQHWFADGYNFIDGVWKGIISGADKMASYIESLPGRLGSLGGQMWSWISDGFKAAIDWVIRGWDGLKFTLPSIDLGPLGSFGGWTIGVPQIPQLAAGGTATEPGVAIVGEHGPEALYLPKGATVDPKLNSIAERMAPGAQSGGGVHIDNLTIKLDGIVDLTNPNAMSSAARTFVTRLRDALKLLDAAYS